MTVQATKKATVGNHPVQTHSWSMGLSAGDLVTDPTDLLPTRFSTGTDMTVYGSVEGKLTSPSALGKHTDTCPATGKILTKYRSRTGTFSGTIDLLPKATGLPTEVSVPSARATITKAVAIDNPCPSGCHPLRTFYGSIMLSAGNFAAVNANVGKGFAWLDLSSSEFDATNNVSISHDIEADVPLTAVTITKTAVALKGRSLAPWVSGTLDFALARTTSSGNKCVSTEYAPTYVSGTMTAMFATGTQAYTDPFDSLDATITRKV
jgi:hypothetical protein